MHKYDEDKGIDVTQYYLFIVLENNVLKVCFKSNTTK